MEKGEEKMEGVVRLGPYLLPAADSELGSLHVGRSHLSILTVTLHWFFNH